jgi:hypothetical protein
MLTQTLARPVHASSRFALLIDRSVTHRGPSGHAASACTRDTLAPQRAHMHMHACTSFSIFQMTVVVDLMLPRCPLRIRKSIFTCTQIEVDGCTYMQLDRGGARLLIVSSCVRPAGRTARSIMIDEMDGSTHTDTMHQLHPSVYAVHVRVVYVYVRACQMPPSNDQCARLCRQHVHSQSIVP